MKTLFAIITLFFLAIPVYAQQETTTQALARIDATQTAMFTTLGKVVDQQTTQAQQLKLLNDKLDAATNSSSAMQARLQSDVADLKVDLTAVKDKLDALTKAMVPNATFTPATSAWGNGSQASFSTNDMMMQPSMMSYSNGMMDSGSGMSSGSGGGGLFRRLRIFGGPGLFKGGRGAGSCGAGG
jgi:ABC-type phosphate transport system auxiliary subunit